MTRVVFSVLTFGLLMVGLHSATAQVTDLSENKIEIRYSFDGAELILFGTTGKLNLQGDYDVAVVVRGPTIPTVVRKKAHHYGIWMNDEAVTFTSAPGYYAVASTRALKDIAEAAELARYHIGYNTLSLTTADQDHQGKDLPAFRQALFRGKEKGELYREDKDKVLLIGEGLFRSNIYLPANVPVGDFHVNAYIFQDGIMVGSNAIPMAVRKEGFERAVYDFAHKQPFFYGITAVLIALLAGWLAGMVGLRKG